MKYLKYFENRATELDMVKSQFFEWLNLNKSHWLKFSKSNTAMIQGFCMNYDRQGKRYLPSGDYGYNFNNVNFHDKYPELFTQKTLDMWFLEWKRV